MKQTYDSLGNPGIFRNDRFWLAGDHVVDPRVNGLPRVQDLIDISERAKHIFKMTEYQGMNVRALSSSLLNTQHVTDNTSSTPFYIRNSTESVPSLE